MSEIITLKEPKQIDDYVACARLGRQVDGRIKPTNVWYAQDKNGKNVVLKKAGQTWLKSDQEGLCEMLLLHEFDVHRKLEHPHVCPALDYVTHNDEGYIVTLRIGSENFEEWLEKIEDPFESIFFPKPKKIDTENGRNIATILGDVADAAAYCHKEGVIHLDIKPKNIAVLEKRGYLIDFGAAMRYPGNHPLLTDGVIGTAQYMAPEHGRGLPKPSSDVFALAVVAYSALMGKHPYRLQINTDAPLTIEYDAPEFTKEELAHLNGAGALMAKGLSKKERERPPMNEFKDAFRELASKQYQTPSAETSKPCPASSE